MNNFVSRVSGLAKKAKGDFSQVQSLSDLKNFEASYLGKKSELYELVKNLKNLSDDEKKSVGPKLQELKQLLMQEVSRKKNILELQEISKKLSADWIDVTKSLPSKNGAIHPISQVQKDVEDIFQSMGFAIADGPELETEWHNFDALNIPSSHPARDMQDTFWVKNDSEKSEENLVLRTHTSNIQIRAMAEHGAPIRAIIPGRVFRNEAVDASHDSMFYQVEGLMVDKGISLANLKGTIETFLTTMFSKKTKIRIRPGYFPFVEPGFEIDFSCALCGGKGCKTCKGSGWIELLGAGMVHPNVLKNCDIDPDVYSGFAFGFGLTRLVMMKYEIDDVRLLSMQKKAFLEQF